MNTKLYDYLLKFLLNCPEREQEILPKIAYSSCEEDFSKFAVVMRKSDFFTKNYGKPNSLPNFPLPTIENIPFFYGEAQVEKHGNTIVINADLIASAFVLLARYEEWLQPNCRDEHGRFLAEHSIAYKGGFLHRPIVDEYGVLLRKYLREAGIELPEPPQEFSNIYLTHDVDFLTRYASFRSFCGAVWRSVKTGNNEISSAISSLRSLKNDAFFTFPWILAQNQSVKNTKAQTIFFLKAPQLRHNSHDKPFYSLSSKAAQQLISLLKKSKATIGLHTSYAASEHKEQIALEKQNLEQQTKTKITHNRYHFLRSQRPADMEFLMENHITHDFTMGYADCAGFRLGTCRAVRYISLETQEVHNLMLHPLLIMDCTLSYEKYMNLTEREAFEYAKKLIAIVQKHNGEIVLLWHNHIFAETEKYNHKELYCKILSTLNSSNENTINS